MKLGFRCEFDCLLNVDASLIAARHEFKLADCPVSVSLPSRYHDEINEPEPTGRNERFGRVVGWSKGNVPEQVHFQKLIVAIDPGVDDHLNIDWNAVNPNESKELDRRFYAQLGEEKYAEIGSEWWSLAERAFDIWCRTMRWKSGFYGLGAPDGDLNCAEAWRYFWLPETQTYLMSYNDTLSLRQSPAISEDIWQAASAALSKVDEPPIWIDVAMSAKRRREAFDFKGAVLDAAIAVEVALRDRVEQALKRLAAKENAVRDRIERHWPISDIVKKRKKISTIPDDLAAADVLNLFTLRNEIMHRRKVSVAPHEADLAIRTLEKSLFQIDDFTFVA